MIFAVHGCSEIVRAAIFKHIHEAIELLVAGEAGLNIIIGRFDAIGAENLPERIFAVAGGADDVVIGVFEPAAGEDIA